MSRRLVGKKMTPGGSRSVSPNVARKKKRQRYRMLYDILEDPAAALPGASSPREMSITEGIVPEDGALAETVGRSSDVASGSGQSSRPKRNGKKPIWMKDYMGDAEEES
nr:hypothetical protein [Tanacetum cinerariifolium]